MARCQKNAGTPAAAPLHPSHPAFRKSAIAAAVALALTGPAYAQEWQPTAEGFIKHGNKRTLGGVDALLPLRQDGTSLFFADVRGQYATRESTEFNLGLGYRKLVGEGKWALGAYGAWDRRRSELDNDFNQITLGAEARSDNLDLRTNLYFPTTDKQLVGLGATNHFAGTSVFRNGVYEEAMRGFDIEAGGPIPIRGIPETRIYFAGYNFKGEDVAPSTTGARVRVEARVLQNLTIGASVQQDDLFGTQSFIEVRYTFGKPASREPRKLRERMTDPWTRDVDIVISKAIQSTEAAFSQRTSDNVVHIDNARGVDGEGDGTFENPYASVADCDAAKCQANTVAEGVGDYNLIRLWQGDSAEGDTYTGFNLLDGQALWGEGFDIFSGVASPGLNPVIDGGEGGGIGVQLATSGTIGNTVAGVTIRNVSTGIYGFNTGGMVVLRNNVIDGGEGIALRNVAGPGETITQAVTIADNQISAKYGIFADNRSFDTGHSEQTLTISGNEISAFYGVQLFNSASNYSIGTAIQDVTLTGNTISAALPVVARNQASEGSRAEQSLTLQNNFINKYGYGFGEAAVDLRNESNTGGVAVQQATLSGNTIVVDGGEGGGTGVYAYHANYGDDATAQSVTLTGNTITGADIGVAKCAYGSGQTVTLNSDNTLDGAAITEAVDVCSGQPF